MEHAPRGDPPRPQPRERRHAPAQRIGRTARPWRHWRSFLVPLVTAAGALLIVLVGTAEATHLRGGTLSWEPTGAPNEAEFTGTVAWRASSWTAPAVGDVLRAGAVPAGFRLHTGEGAFETFHLQVTYMDTADDWLLSRIVDASLAPGVRHLYPAPSDGGDPWQAYWTECCRLSNIPPAEHVNNPGDATTLATTVDLRAGNASPRVWVPPVYVCERDAPCRVPITALDPDGDAIALRFSTSHEAIGSGHPPAAPSGNTFDPPGPPWSLFPATLDASQPALLWDTTGVFMGVGGVPLYSVQFMAEDGATKTPMDFLIQIRERDPPFWRTPPSPCGATLLFPAGVASSFTVETAHNDSAADVGLLVDPATPLDAFPGATVPLPPPGNPAASTFTWTPPASAVGEVRSIAYWAHTGNHWAEPCRVAVRVVDPPRADFSCAGVPGADRRVRFTDASADSGTVVAWSWDFGDATTSTDPNPLHDYPTRGNYTVRLTVTDDDGLTETATRTCFAPGNRSPALAPVPDQRVHEGEPLAFAVHATDPDGDALVFWMEPAPHRTARFGDGAFTWTPVPGMRGAYVVGFFASDGRLAAALRVNVTVLPAPEEAAPRQSDSDGDGAIDSHDPCPAEAGPDGCAAGDAGGAAGNDASTSSDGPATADGSAPGPGPAADAAQAGAAGLGDLHSTGEVLQEPPASQHGASPGGTLPGGRPDAGPTQGPSDAGAGVAGAALGASGGVAGAVAGAAVAAAAAAFFPLFVRRRARRADRAPDM